MDHHFPLVVRDNRPVIVYAISGLDQHFSGSPVFEASLYQHTTRKLPEVGPTAWIAREPDW
jgi:hypothetical protein